MTLKFRWWNSHSWPMTPKRLQPAGIRRFRLPGSGKWVLAAMPPGPPSAILGAK